MSVCPSCGFRNAGSDPFCRNPACGAFLGWGEDETSSGPRPPLRIDPPAAGQPASAEAPAEDTQPFDTAAEARRPDPPARPRAPAPEAGRSGARSALGRSEPPQAPHPPAPAGASPAGPARPAGPPAGGSGARPDGTTPAGQDDITPGDPAPGDPAPGDPAPGGPTGRERGAPATTSWFDRGDSGAWAPLPPPPGLTPGPPRQAGAPPAAPPREPGPPPREAQPPEWDRGLVEPPREAPRQAWEAEPWQSHGQAPDRQPEWRTALGLGRESAPGQQWAAAPPPQPRQPAGGEATRAGATPGGEVPEGEATVTRDAIRAAIRGEAVPRGSVPGVGGPRNSRSDRGDRLVLPPATGGAPPSRGPSSFPSEAELLKRPPRWERMLRRLPVSVPGEGPLRRAPSPRDRERQRALLRLGVLVTVIVLVGGGLWVTSVRGGSSPRPSATGGTAPPPTLVRVRPAGVSASTQSGSRIADNVIDGKLGTFWSRLVPSQDDQPFLRFSFDRPVGLGRLTIAAGASGAEFSKRPRPQDIELQFSDGTTLRTTLADRTGFQTVSFRPREVDRVRLVVLSTYPSSGPQRTSISEIRFFAVKR